MRTVRSLMIALCVAAVAGMATPVFAACPGCAKVAKAGDGFCCDKGTVFGTDLTSKKLYTALAGKVVVADSAKKGGCPTCKTSTNCDACRVASGKRYASTVAYTLAKGKVLSAEKMAGSAHGCPGCTTAFKKSGKCDKCAVGFVGGRKYAAKDYDAAVAAHAVLVKAVETAGHCEKCAVAMVTDGRCEECKVQFKDGKVAS